MARFRAFFWVSFGLASIVACGGNDDAPASVAAGASFPGCPAPTGVPDFASCGGNRFASGACQDGACASTDLSKQAYAGWKERVRALTGFDEATYRDRVEIVSVEQTDGPVFVFVRIDFILTYGWVRIRDSATLELGEFPLAAPPDAEAFARAVRLSAPESGWQGAGQVNEVACPPAVNVAVDSCTPGMTIDWCDLRLDKRTGRPTVRARATLDEAANKCKNATVDVGTGALESCLDNACSSD